MSGRRRGPPAGDAKPKPRGAKARLPDEDVALWAYAAQTIEPVHKLKPRVPDTGADAWSDASDLPDRMPAPPESKSVPAAATAKPSPGHRAAVKQPPKATPALAEFDRRKARKIAAGKLDIEARLDLHGMRQAEAHRELRGFITACAGRGLATVLIITGKGARAMDEAAEQDWTEEKPDRGVLRRMVPLWLAEPDMRRHVISFHSAGVRHGGDGALYVQLRTRAAKRDRA
ncbi:MAG: Smr/MutS family protein [Hyphomicrobiaceae bacterium]